MRMSANMKDQNKLTSHKKRSKPYPSPSRCLKGIKEVHQDLSKMAMEKKDWKHAKCSVCMEYPHNAVLLLCSSHDKGCRPYMCGTSYRYSNCLDQYKKAYTKETAACNSMLSNSKGREVTELACPLCRGQVKGMTVVEAARDYLNTKKRNCTQESCLFVGSYRKLRKHVRVEHPFTNPHKVDPTDQQKWKTLESEREREDVLSTIRSSMPGSVVMGDYVIERGHHSNHSTGFDDMRLFRFMEALDNIRESGGGGVSLNARRQRLEMERTLARARVRIRSAEDAARLRPRRAMRTGRR